MGLFHSPRIVTDGLVLCLDAANTKSYPGSGTSWFDLSKTKTTAVGVGSPSFTNGYVAFDGLDDYFYLGSELVYGGGTTISEMSVFAWTRTTFNSGTPGVWNNNNWSILDFDRSEVFTFALNGTGEVQLAGASTNTGGIGTTGFYDIVGTETYNDGNWHMVGWTFSVADQKIIMYADGEVDATFTGNGSMTALGSGVTRYGLVGDGSEAGSVNGGQNNLFYDGDVASILFYDNKVLTDVEVKQNFEAFRGRFGL